MIYRKHQQASAKPCRVFFLFSCFYPVFFPVFLCVYTNRIYGRRVMWMIMPTGLTTFSIIRKKETVSYSRLDLPYTQIQCQTEDKQTES